MTHTKKGSRHQLSIRLLIVNISLSSLLALGISTVYSHLTHSLNNYPQWQTLETTLHKPPMGAKPFISRLNALANNQLQLGTWHGFHFIYHKKPTSLQSWSFTATFSTNSYLKIIYNLTDTDFEAIQLSTYPLFQNQWLTGSLSGEFKETRPLTTIPLENNRPYLITLEQQNSWLQISIDGIPYQLLSYSHFKPHQSWGFQSGQNNVRIHDIHTTTQNGQQFSENFKPTPSYKIGIGLTLLLCLLIMVIPKTTFHHATLAILLICLSLPAYTYTWYIKTHQSHYYAHPTISNVWFTLKKKLKPLINKINPNPTDAPQVTRSTIQVPYPDYNQLNQFIKIFENDPPDPILMIHNALRIKQYHFHPSPKNQKTMLILGASQTWGEGEGIRHNRFADQLQKKFIKNNIPISCLVLARQACTLEYLTHRYKTIWSHLNPDVVLLNIGTNDWELTDYPTEDKASHFENYITDLITFNQERGIQTILCKEANSIEKRGKKPLPLHKSLDKLSQKYQVPCLDPHQLLLDNYQKGTLFWDHVHFTDFGSTLVAQYLFNELTPLIKSIRQQNTRKQPAKNTTKPASLSLPSKEWTLITDILTTYTTILTTPSHDEIE